MTRPEIDEQHYRDGAVLLAQVAPIFEGAHSFVMMTVLANLTAQWLIGHPEEQHDILAETFSQLVDQLVAVMQQSTVSEVRH